MTKKMSPRPGRLVKDEIDAPGLSVARAGGRTSLPFARDGGATGAGRRRRAGAGLRMQMTYDLAKIRESAAIAITRLAPNG